MSLTLYYHPLASFCYKPLIALYEAGIDFEPVVVDLGEERSREAFWQVWPFRKFPVLVDAASGDTVGESATVVEYLERFSPSGSSMLAGDPRNAWRARMWDRIFDDELHLPMQRIVLDSLRPDGAHDEFGNTQAIGQIERTYGILEDRLPAEGWMVDGAFGLAECSAAPALFWANTVHPLGDRYPVVKGYLQRVKDRPSVARVLSEAAPYFHMFPLDRKPSL